MHTQELWAKDTDVTGIILDTPTGQGLTLHRHRHGNKTVSWSTQADEILKNLCLSLRKNRTFVSVDLVIKNADALTTHPKQHLSTFTYEVGEL